MTENASSCSGPNGDALEALSVLEAEAASRGLTPWAWSGSPLRLVPIHTRDGRLSGGLGTTERHGIRVR